jgi:DNA-binding CsgD family transcriptional regulator
MGTALAHAVAHLDARERYIVERRLMADASEELSLAEIARTLGVSRERARQLESRAKSKLRRLITEDENPAVREWVRSELPAAPPSPPRAVRRPGPRMRGRKTEVARAGFDGRDPREHHVA